MKETLQKLQTKCTANFKFEQVTAMTEENIRHKIRIANNELDKAAPADVSAPLPAEAARPLFSLR